MDLDSKKYAELQIVAKELGLKANVKADKLLKAIKEYYHQKRNKEEQDAAARDQDAARDRAPQTQGSEEDAPSTVVFVNTRRRKGNRRKLSDTEPVTECDSKDEAEVAVSGGHSGSKKTKRKTEPQKGTNVAETDQQPGINDGDNVHTDAGKAPKVSKAGKIPRYQRLQQKKTTPLKPVTPNFKKLHEAQFNKMESIDSYVQRKTKQMDTYRSSVKELKKANRNQSSIFSPIPVNKTLAEETRRLASLSASKALPDKADGKESAVFRPSVISTRRINVRFSEDSHNNNNKNKMSLLKTPVRMSSRVTMSTPKKQTDTTKANNVKTPTYSKAPGPFIFTGNTSISTTPGTQKKPSFDLQASLARPLNYKPHKGKLKPFGEVKENATTAGNSSIVSNSHQKNYKQHQIKTREDRRAKQMEQRKQKKENMLGTRRGLVMM